MPQPKPAHKIAAEVRIDGQGNPYVAPTGPAIVADLIVLLEIAKFRLMYDAAGKSAGSIEVPEPDQVSKLTQPA